ncbi:hypothetical protein [Desulfitobacterium sp. AusDCA]|uniref:hypothetical protein n=1 Tax=Desulfitobacterium sp. AusDCA TaxID=3240383 RepID=UPI003DA6D757
MFSSVRIVHRIAKTGDKACPACPVALQGLTGRQGSAAFRTGPRALAHRRRELAARLAFHWSRLRRSTSAAIRVAYPTSHK